MAKSKNAKAIELIGSPEKLINQLIKDSAVRAESLQSITLEGPPHKQIQHTLVLKRLEQLIAVTKKTTGAAIKFSKGQTIFMESPDGEFALPVSIPATSLEGTEDKDGVVEKLSKGPWHEALYTAILLQIIEALIVAQQAKANE